MVQHNFQPAKREKPTITFYFYLDVILESLPFKAHGNTLQLNIIFLSFFSVSFKIEYFYSFHFIKI